MKLLIRNLNRLTTADELTKLFQEFGKVQSCNLIMDKKSGTSKGFGFIEMPKPGETKAAVKTLNNKTIGGLKIRVKKAEAQKVDRGSSDNADRPRD
jgi:RNA recognition motif-containing protein